MKRRIFVVAFMFFIISMAGCSSEADNDAIVTKAKNDTILSKARKEGKIIMLELGSVGCIPCEQMKPVMEKLRTNYKGKLEVLFIDVRKDKENGRRFGVSMIPTQVFLDKEGKEFYRHIGFYPYEEIVPVLKRAGL